MKLSQKRPALFCDTLENESRFAESADNQPARRAESRCSGVFDRLIEVSSPDQTDTLCLHQSGERVMTERRRGVLNAGLYVPPSVRIACVSCLKIGLVLFRSVGRGKLARVVKKLLKASPYCWIASIAQRADRHLLARYVQDAFEVPDHVEGGGNSGAGGSAGA
jgi:hypothetical protein